MTSRPFGLTSSSSSRPIGRGPWGLFVKHTYHALDGLRGIAAMCVVVFHAASSARPLTPSGELAPDLFFVLSGFVLTYAYQHKLAEGMTFRRFMAVRAIRLYPLYAVAVAISAVWLACGLGDGEPFHIAEVVRAALFVPAGPTTAETPALSAQSARVVPILRGSDQCRVCAGCAAPHYAATLP
ncbi:acyltransferase family protein [Caulobacter segnis]